MARTPDESGEELISGINVTPLVDVVLVLLIIFMVTATYIVRQSIEVELPRAAHGGESVGTMLNVVLDKEAKLYVDGTPADEDELRRKVADALAKDKDARAIISADKLATHGSVVRIIDLVKGAGIAHFAINIEREEKDEGR